MLTDFQTLYGEFDDRLRRFVRRRAPEDAVEDILQEAHLRIHARIGTLREEDRLEAWLYRVTRSAVVDHYRRRRETAELPETLPMPDGPDADAAGELAPSVRGMIGCLPEKSREALLLSELQGLPQQELANRLGISLPGAKSRVQRGREKLRRALLDCCHFEFDRLGRVMHYKPKCDHCAKDSDGCEQETP